LDENDVNHAWSPPCLGYVQGAPNHEERDIEGRGLVLN
jgi:hypothetical protein